MDSELYIRDESTVHFLKPNDSKDFTERPDSFPARKVEYSRNGDRVALLQDGVVRVFHADSFQELVTLHIPNVSAVAWSPKATYLITWNKPNGEEDKPLKLWEVESVSLLAQFSEKHFVRDSWPSLQFSDDERVFARLAVSEVQVHEAPFSDRYVSRIRHPGGPVRGFALSPLGDSIAIFLAPSKGMPGSVLLRRFPNTEATIASKSFFKGDTVTFRWAPNGRTLLFSTEQSMSDSSYYGDSKLYIFSDNGRLAENVAVEKEGPVHDFQWAPDSSKFIAITGRVPPRATLFNHRGKVIHDFGDAPRNAAFWSPHGRFLVLAGFGNMAGQMDFWNAEDMKLLGHNEVDNGFSVFTYYGEGPIIHKEYDQLFDVNWRPAAPGVYPDRPVSPRIASRPAAVVQAATVKAAVYRPRGSTGLVSAMMRTSGGSGGGGGGGRGVVGAVPVVGAPAARGPAKGRGRGGGGGGGQLQQAARAMTDEQKAKESRKIQTKLHQIAKLQAKAKEGGTLNSAEQTKVATEGALQARLAELQK